MDGTMIMIMGFALAFNMIVIKMKFEHGRSGDAWFDLGSLVILGWLFSGSVGGLAMGTIASAIISVYLFFSPPKLDWDGDNSTSGTTDL